MKTIDIKDQYFMDDSREGGRLEKKVNARAFVDKYLKEDLDDFRHMTILEAGCGPGMFLEVLGSNYTNHAITGIDISRQRIEQANAKLSALNNAEAIQADIYTLPFPNDHFDLIYSRFLFEYLQKPADAATELYRVCKPGGKLLLQDLDGQFSFYPELSHQFKTTLQTLQLRTGFDPDIGRKLFSIGKSAGFSFLNIRTEMYHKVFGKIDKFNYDLWSLKLEIALKNITPMFNDDSIEQLKNEMLQSFRCENAVMFSNLFTLSFKKPGI